MSKFSIMPQQVKNLSDDERRIADQLGQYADELDSVRADLRMKIKSRYGIDQGLVVLRDQLRQYRDNMSVCNSVLDSVIQNYEKTENLISGTDTPSFTISDTLTGGNLHVEDSDYYAIDGLTLHNIMNIISNYDIGDIIEAIKKFKDMNPGEALSKWLEDNGIYISGIPVISGLINGLSSWDDVKGFISDIPGSIKEEAKNYVIDKTSFEGKIEGGDSLYSKSISGEYGSLSLDVGAYDYYADAEGHVFKKDENGNLVFDPHVSAEVGASFTALNIAGDVAIGNEYLGVGANGEVTVGRIAGNASAEAGLFDEKGRFDPNASFHGNLEAVAVEAKGEVSGNIGGVEAKASGSVYVGAGAHANIEISGGKIKADLGVALGVGVSLGFEIDFSGVKNCIQDACHSILGNIFGW